MILALDSFKHWYFEQGVYLIFSAVAHAAIMVGSLLILGMVVAPKKMNSVGPVFSGDFKTDFPSSEFEPYDTNVVTIDPADGKRAEESLDAAQTDGLQDAASMINSSSTAASVAGSGTGVDAGGAVGFGSSSSVEGIGGIMGFGTGGGGGSDLRSLTPLDPINKGDGGGRPRSSARHGGVTQAGGAGDAVDGVLGGIRGQLEEGDLLVCWLVDGSISVIPDRQIIAERLEPFFHQIEKRSQSSYRLMNAVVAFASSTQEIVGPTKFSVKIPEAIRSMPVDNSGIENVMTAVETCVNQYTKRWKGGMLIVLWTDESGNDILRLEETIALCRKRRVVVRIVGPSAVLGSERGTHYYVDKSSGYGFRLPVKRGPDTCLPEKLAVPYWHDAALPPWVSGGAQVAAGMPWYGGPHREGLLSGIGPYALTRLALETGGAFTLLDHAEDQGPFKLDKMKRYLPDYESAADYVAMLEKHPLRKAVSLAVQRSYSRVNIMPPVMAFVMSRSDRYPYQIISGYQPPAVFRAQIVSELPRQEYLAKAASVVIEEALTAFGEKGMEQEYLLDRSPRWRAWYDLNRGRLLAMSVRHLEYILTCEEIKRETFFRPDTNRIELRPVAKYKAGKVIEARALEAHRLLSRCKEQNKETPWALMAQWELDHALGLEVKQIAIPPPQPGPPGVPPPPAPTIFLPTL